MFPTNWFSDAWENDQKKEFQNLSVIELTDFIISSNSL